MLHVDGFPRRGRLDCLAPAEAALVEAVRKIEAVGAGPQLTDAVVLVSRARDKVADFIDDCDLGKQLCRDYGNRAVEQLVADDDKPVTAEWLVAQGWERGIHWPNIQTAARQLLEWRGAGLWIENTPIAKATTRGKLRLVMAALSDESSK